MMMSILCHGTVTILLDMEKMLTLYLMVEGYIMGVQCNVYLMQLLINFSFPIST